MSEVKVTMGINRYEQLIAIEKKFNDNIHNSLDWEKTDSLSLFGIMKHGKSTEFIHCPITGRYLVRCIYDGRYVAIYSDKNPNDYVSGKFPWPDTKRWDDVAAEFDEMIKVH